MKRVRSHVLIQLDTDAKKTLDRLFNRASTIYERFAGWNRLFIRSDWDNTTNEWKFEDVKNPTISKRQLMADLNATSKSLGEMKEIVDAFREEVKAT